ncbi:MAG: hypothetical protein Fur006_43150 [Coleofasciculaceae cyanobacterium]
MTKILIIYYTQSGDVERATQSFTKFLNTPEIELTWERIQPKADYPYPWSFQKFFDVFPECINEEPPAIEPPKFDPNKKFDLILIAYQVWFLSPSLPIQAFFKSEHAQVLRNTKIITLIVCRNMWHSASEIMKKMISQVGGTHIDNVVVTHQGPPLATFITTPRLLLTGKKDKFLGTLPPGGVRDADIDALSRFGWQIANNLAALNDSSNQSLLKNLGAVKVNPRYVIPEIIGRIVYTPWAKLARFFGKPGSSIRQPIIYLFAILLILAIPIVLILSLLLRVLLYPLINPKIKSYVETLKFPSEAT